MTYKLNGCSSQEQTKMEKNISRGTHGARVIATDVLKGELRNVNVV